MDVNLWWGARNGSIAAPPPRYVDLTPQNMVFFGIGVFGVVIKARILR